MDLPIENKVAKANILQIDLLDYVSKTNLLTFDIKQGLWQEMVLKEKDFRQFIKAFDWEKYRNENVCLFCSVDAVVPAWAYMIVTTMLKKVDANVLYGSQNQVREILFFENLSNIKIEEFTGQRVMVKGCSDIPSPTKAYVELTKLLMPTVKSLMFGEPCSAVPVFKGK